MLKLLCLAFGLWTGLFVIIVPVMMLWRFLFTGRFTRP